jgi:hypothetical protein
LTDDKGLHKTEIRVGAWATEYEKHDDGRHESTGFRVEFQVGGFVESDPLLLNPRARIIWQPRQSVNALFDPKPDTVAPDVYAKDCAASFERGGAELDNYRKKVTA